MDNKDFPPQGDFVGLIDKLQELIEANELSEQDLEDFALLPEAEEVVFNVIEGYRGNDPAVLESLKVLGKARMKYLKPMFAGKSVGRGAPGKMEYDTTLEALREKGLLNE